MLLQMSCVALWTKSSVLVMLVLRFVAPALFPVADCVTRRNNLGRALLSHFWGELYLKQQVVKRDRLNERDCQLS